MLQLFPQGSIEDPLKDCTTWSTFSAPYIVNRFPVKPLQLYKVNSILWSFNVIKRFGLLHRGGSIQSKVSLFIWGYGRSGPSEYWSQIPKAYQWIMALLQSGICVPKRNWSNKVSAVCFLIFLYIALEEEKVKWLWGEQAGGWWVRRQSVLSGDELLLTLSLDILS